MLAYLYLIGTVAEIYPFDKAKSPPSKELYVLYTFFAYADAHAVFRDMQVTASEPAGGLQLSLVEHDVFWKGIDPKTFCCSNQDITDKVCSKPDTLTFRSSHAPTLEPTYSIQLTSDKQDFPFDIPIAGVYLLIVSNCGSSGPIQFSGTAEVRNLQGHIPAIDMPKRPLYFWLGIAYAGLLVVWALTSLRWRGKLFSVHHYILGVISLGLIECVFRCVYLEDWNATGYRKKSLFISVICSSVIKNVCAYVVVLIASLGLGVVRGSLDKKTWRHIILLAGACIVFNVLYELMLAFRHSHNINFFFIVLCMLPDSAINGGVFCWIFTALASLIKKLKDENQMEKLAVFQALWRTLLLAVSVCTLCTLYHTFSTSRNITFRWQVQWIFTDAVNSIGFLLVLLIVMYQWAPHENSHRFVYSTQLVHLDVDSNEGFDDDDEWGANVFGISDHSSDPDDD